MSEQEIKRYINYQIQRYANYNAQQARIDKIEEEHRRKLSPKTEDLQADMMSLKSKFEYLERRMTDDIARLVAKEFEKQSKKDKRKK
jgi:predicted nuclease with TOPRIM domain